MALDARSLADAVDFCTGMSALEETPKNYKNLGMFILTYIIAHGVFFLLRRGLDRDYSPALLRRTQTGLQHCD